MSLPNEIIIEIYNCLKQKTKYNFIKVFPFLKVLLPECDNDYCDRKICYEMKSRCIPSCCHKRSDVSKLEQYNVCDLECADHFMLDSQKINYDGSITVFYSIEDECHKCGRFMISNIVATGYQICDTIKPLTRRQMFQNFIKTHTVYKKDNMVRKSSLHNYFENYCLNNRHNLKTKGLAKFVGKFLKQNEKQYLDIYMVGDI